MENIKEEFYNKYNEIINLKNQKTVIPIFSMKKYTMCE